MDQNCLLPTLSSAYRQGHSTESVLLKVHADILHNMEQQMVTLLVLIDLSAAFDTVDHQILFQCLESSLASVIQFYHGISHICLTASNVLYSKASGPTHLIFHLEFLRGLA